MIDHHESILSRTRLPHGASAIILRDGLVLASRRRDYDLWGFPGGKVDAGESPEQAVLRELREETGCEGFSPYFFLEGRCAHANPIHPTYWVYAFLVELSAEAHPEAPAGEPPCQWMEIGEFLAKSAFPDFNAQALQRVGALTQSARQRR